MKQTNKEIKQKEFGEALVHFAKAIWGIGWLVLLGYIAYIIYW